MQWIETDGQMQLGTVRMCLGCVHCLIADNRQINPDVSSWDARVDEERRNLEGGQAIGLILESSSRTGEQERRVRRIEGGQNMRSSHDDNRSN
jgi:hypothetical protein